MRPVARGALTLAPLSLFTAACSMRAWTPSTSVAYWGEESTATYTVTVPAQGDAIAKWQLPPNNPWAPYSKYTLLTALDSVPRQIPLPDVNQLEVVQRAAVAGSNVGAAGLPNDTLWIVDLRGAASVAFGTALSRRAREPASLVLTFNNWPAENELIPAEEALAALVTMQPKLPQASDVGTRPVFLLDAWRLAYRYDEPDDDVTDNRYVLSSTDLPAPTSLNELGIRRIVYVVESLDDTTQEEDDLHQLFLAYQQAGISIYMVDLNLMTREIVPERWGEVLHDHVLWVEYRTTVLDEPSFYVRARGGFGGVHGSPLRGGGGYVGWGSRGGGGGG